MSKNNIPLQIPNKKVNYSPQFRNLIPGNGAEINPVDERVGKIDTSIGGMVASPVISVSNNRVTATCETEDATIMFYIKDDSSPRFAIYTAPFKIGADMTLIFWAQKAGMMSSLPVVSDLTFGMEQPVFSMDKYTGTVSMVNPNRDNFPASYIMYTTDGSKPSANNGTRYKSPFAISQATTVKAVVIYYNVQSAETVKYYPVINLNYLLYYGYSHNISTGNAIPTIDNNPATGVDIYNTTDGSTPNQYATKSDTVQTTMYGAQINAKFIGYKDDCIPSQILDLLVGLIKPDTPTISFSGSTVTINPNTPSGEGANYNIYYTTDGSTPSAQNGTLYTTPFTINSGCTINAVVYYTLGSCYSDVATLVTYTVNVRADIGGSVTTTANVVVAGGSVTLTATADTGYAFSEWDDHNISNPRTINNVQQDIDMKALFEIATSGILVKIYCEGQTQNLSALEDDIWLHINNEKVSVYDGWITGEEDEYRRYLYKRIELSEKIDAYTSPSIFKADHGSEVIAMPGNVKLGDLGDSPVDEEIPAGTNEIIITLILIHAI